jgi:hypothetical protein
VCGHRATRGSADGRHPVDDVTEHFGVNIYQVRADPAKSPLSNSEPTQLAPSALENDQLTILTGWGQALAEALVNDPECVEASLGRTCTPVQGLFRVPNYCQRPSHTILHSRKMK